MINDQTVLLVISVKTFVAEVLTQDISGLGSCYEQGWQRIQSEIMAVDVYSLMWPPLASIRFISFVVLYRRSWGGSWRGHRLETR